MDTPDIIDYKWPSADYTIEVYRGIDEGWQRATLSSWQAFTKATQMLRLYQAVRGDLYHYRIASAWR